MSLAQEYGSACLPTVSAQGKSKPYGKSTEAQTIEARRKKLGVSQTALCREAAILPETYTNLKSGATTPQRRIVVRLTAALDRLAGQAPAPSADVIAGLFRAALTVFANEVGADVQRALQVEAINGAEGRARRLAFYVTVNAFDVRRPIVARIVGYSKQAASKALKWIEDRRETDAELNQLINRVGYLLTGKDLA